MKKNFIIVILLTLFAPSIWSQCFITLNNNIGLDTNADILLQFETKSCFLRNDILPIDISTDFAVYQNSLYLHSNKMDLSSIIANSASSTTTNNYVLINRISTNESIYDLVDIEIELNINSQYKCVNENFIAELEEILETNFTSSDSDIIKILDYITRKLSHAYNCCEEDSNKKRNPYECSLCEHDLLSLTKLLKDNGYISVDDLVQAVSGQSGLTTTINESSVPNIAYDIKIGDIDFTKLLVKNATSMLNYTLNMYVYDDVIETSNIPCYTESPPTLSLRKQSSTFTEDVVIINYDAEYKAFLKATVSGSMHPFAIDTYIYNPHPKWNEITTLAISETERIYNQSDFDGIFNFIHLNEEENDALKLDNRSNYIEVKNFPNGSSCYLGMMAPSLEPRTNQYWNHKNNTCSWGAYVNIPNHNFLGDPESVGFTMAHEFGHALTSKGRWIIGEVLGYKNASFHDDSKPNLMSSGPESSGNLPEDRDESFTPLVKYLIYHFLLCSDCNY